MEYAHSIAVDNAGSIYSVGYFSNTVDFDPGLGVFNMDAIQGMAFISKLDSIGNLVWAKQYGGNSCDAYDIKIAPNGDLVIVGAFANSGDFDPGSGSQNATSSGNGDVFVLRLDSNGGFLWMKHFGGPQSSVAKQLAIDTNGSIYVTGYIYGTVDFDPGTGINSVSPIGSYDAYVLKVDFSGQYQWVATFGSSNGDTGDAIEIDSFGNILCAGTFAGALDFDPGPGNSMATAFGQDLYIVKLTPAGSLLNVGTIGGFSTTFRWPNIAVKDSGSFVVTGSFDGTADFDPGSGVVQHGTSGGKDVFVLYLDNNLARSNSFVFGDVGNDEGIAAAFDGYGNLFLAGRTNSPSIDMNPGSGTSMLTGFGATDNFVSMFDHYGNFVRHEQIGGSDQDLIDDIEIRDRAVFIFGHFRGLADFESGTTQQLLSSYGNFDCYVAKLFTCRPEIDSIVVSSCISYLSPGGNVWNASGTYQDTVLSVGGCEVYLTIFLTIVQPTASNINVLSCNGSYVSPDSITYVSSGTYTAIVPNQNGCDSVITINLTVTDLNNTVTVSGGTILSNQLTGGYQWIDCSNGNAAILGETNSFYSPIVSGIFAVVVSDSGCIDTSTCEVVVGIQEQLTPDFSVCPNPNNGSFQLTGDLGTLKSISIFDMLGKPIFYRSDASLKKIALSDVPAGMYVIVLQLEDGHYFSKPFIVRPQ